MTRSDYQILFTALGFLAVVMKGKKAQKDGAKQARDLADLIEAFCRTERPDLFKTGIDGDVAELDQMIEDMKEDEFHIGHPAVFTANKNYLHQIYDRLLQRHRAYASDEMIAGEVAHFLEEEIRHKAEADMMIVRVQGDKDIFSPCERMATAITEMLKTTGNCDPADLEAKGFSPEEIKRHWRMAYGLAKVELNWMDS